MQSPAKPFSKFSEMTQEKMMKLLSTPHSIITTDFSSLSDNQVSEETLSSLLQENNYEDTPEDKIKKNKVLEYLKSIINNWISDISFSLNMKPSGGLYVFGSYRMQVNQRDSDIDTVCIVPDFINRDDHFFRILFEILRTKEEVKDIYPIADAQVPLIKLKLMDIPVDILFARLQISFIQEINFLDDCALLKIIDEQSYKSFNGIRTADLILKYVNNLDEFRQFLKLIKLWAKSKLIYSSMLGYLGGISWAILAAKICQLYPNYCSAKLLERFFFIYSNWNFEDMPILIEKLIIQPEDVILKKFSVFQWDNNPDKIDNKSDFNIITPAFPCMNSSHNVSSSTSKIIKKHLKEGYKIINLIRNKEKKWKDLFEKYNIFEKYPRFIEISIICTNNNYSDFLVWKGHYESKLRKLSRLIENSSYNNLISIRFNPICYDFKDQNNYFCSNYYIGLRITKSNINYGILMGIRELDFTDIFKEFLDYVENRWIIPDYMTTRIRIINNDELSEEIRNKNEIKSKKKILLSGKMK